MTVKQQRGQFFTTNDDVRAVMSALLTVSAGTVLEPSAGAGDLVTVVESRPGMQVDAVELDSSIRRLCASRIIYADFFTYAAGRDGTYDAVFGNPPYVAWKGLEAATKRSARDVKTAYSDKTNLYHLFIDRCVDLLAPGGELVFIVPKEWLYTSSAQPLREKIMRDGALTHLVDCGEEKLFTDADVPALLIFRFVKGASASVPVLFAASLQAATAGVWDTRALVSTAGRFLLLPPARSRQVTGWGRLADAFRVHVGMVSGSDAVFRVPAGVTVEPACVQPYLTTKGIEPFIDVNHVADWSSMPAGAAAYLLQHKPALLARRIAHFDDSNWWRYGAVRNRDVMLSGRERFYAYAKTRSVTPFFTSPSAVMFSGGILGLFRVAGGPVTVGTAVRVLNSAAYRDVLEGMFLTTGNKLSLQPATLEDAPFPVSESDALAWLTAVGG